MKKKRVPIYIDRSDFLALPDQEKADAYFQLVDLLGKNSKPKKNSQNSNIAPSTDLTRKHERSRTRSKFGPPKGHPGTSRHLVEDPDEVVFLPITECPRTGQAISSNSKSYQSHQVLELEPLCMKVIEIRKQTTTGPDGKTVIAPNPHGVSNYDRLGPNLKAFIAFMRFQLDIPWGKIQETLEAMVQERLGAGTIARIFRQAKKMTDADYLEYKEELRDSAIVGCDETGIHVMGKKWWVHTVRNETTTVFQADPGRSHTVASSILGQSFSGILLSDFFGAYNPRFYGQETKFAKCVGSHLMRHIKYAKECEGNRKGYAHKFHQVIIAALHLKKHCRFETPYFRKKRKEILKTAMHLLDRRVRSTTHEGEKLRVLLRKYFDDIFKFLFVEGLPYDNNGSERDIREVVRSRKIAGAYRTEQGVQQMAQLKSVVLTQRKRGGNLWEYLRLRWTPIIQV